MDAKYIILTVIMLTTLLVYRLSSQNLPTFVRNPTQNPIILIPGLGGSNIFAVWDLPRKSSINFPYKSRELAQIWADPWFVTGADNFGAQSKYLLEIDMDPVTISYRDREGVSTTAWRSQKDFGSLESVRGIGKLKLPVKIHGVMSGSQIRGREYARPQFNSLIKFLETNGYTEKLDLFGAPYDWRKIADDSYSTLYYNKLKILIENAYSVAGKKVCIVSHSLGGIIFHRFLTEWLENSGVNRAWKNKYISSWIPVNVPHGGSPLTLKAAISGVDIGGGSNASLLKKQLPVVSKSGGLHLSFPNPELFKNVPVVIHKGLSMSDPLEIMQSNHRLSLIEPFYRALIRPYHTTRQLMPPGVRVHSFSSSCKPTILSSIYEDWESDPTHLKEDSKVAQKLPRNYIQEAILNNEESPHIGDGTVPYISQMVPVLWKRGGVMENADSNSMNIPVTIDRFSGDENDCGHTSLLSNPLLHKKLFAYTQM